VTEILAETLTRFEVSGDGARVRFNCTDAAGAAVSLNLPVDCLRQLVMTLPLIAQDAFRRLHRDETLRLVFPAGSWAFEQDAGGTDTMIVTVSTKDGFQVSFGFPRADLEAFGDCLHAVLGPEQLSPMSLN
jgi:hypothetical protein